jgi:protoheme ferro-lyase
VEKKDKIMKKIALLLTNLGTPDSANVKKGVAEFLKNYSAFQKQPL